MRRTSNSIRTWPGAAEERKSAAKLHSTDLAGKVRIGTLNDPRFIRLGEFLTRALERHPLVEIALRNEFTGAAYEAVRSGTLDASFYFGEITRASARGRFRAHGFEPSKVVSADNGGGITNLVESEVGLSPVREDVALERERAGAVCVWDKARSSTDLWFIHLAGRARRPPARDPGAGNRGAGYCAVTCRSSAVVRRRRSARVTASAR